MPVFDIMPEKFSNILKPRGLPKKKKKGMKPTKIYKQINASLCSFIFLRKVKKNYKIMINHFTSNLFIYLFFFFLKTLWRVVEGIVSTLTIKFWMCQKCGKMKITTKK
jgi:hypothetical protein